MHVKREQAIDAASDFARGRRLHHEKSSLKEVLFIDDDMLAAYPKFRKGGGKWFICFGSFAFDAPPSMSKFWVDDESGQVTVARITWREKVVWPFRLPVLWLRARCAAS